MALVAASASSGRVNRLERQNSELHDASGRGAGASRPSARSSHRNAAVAHSTRPLDWRDHVRRFLDDPHSSAASRYFNYFMLVLIIGSVVLLCL
jgi:hypothetical protein